MPRILSCPFSASVPAGGVNRYEMPLALSLRRLASLNRAPFTSPPPSSFSRRVSLGPAMASFSTTAAPSAEADAGSQLKQPASPPPPQVKFCCRLIDFRFN